MSNIKVSDIIRYPLKSCKGTSLQQSTIHKKGLLYDRQWALFDKEMQVVTGRKYPQLLDLEVRVDGDQISIIHNDSQLSLNVNVDDKKPRAANIFSYDMEGFQVSKELDQWFSDYLNKDCSLMVNDSRLKRPVLSKHNGQSGDILGFADQAPILLLSEGSMSDLNNRLEEPISYDRFRPNIVVKGTTPYAEDSWDIIKIGDCTFRVIQKCERCVFTTIDPNTKTKHPKQEPLRTLAKYRKNASKGVDFGVHMVPITMGSISHGDVVVVL